MQTSNYVFSDFLIVYLTNLYKLLWSSIMVASPFNIGTMYTTVKHLYIRVATVREKCLENEIFSKSGNFVDGQGNLERFWKVREKSEHLKINSCGMLSLPKIYLFCSKGERMYFLMRWSKPISLFIWGS